MNNAGKWIIVVFMAMVSVLIIMSTMPRTPAIKEQPKYPIAISPITEEWVQTENGRALQVTYGTLVLNIPEKYRPNPLTKELKSIIFPLLWPRLRFGKRKKDNEYLFDIMIYPKNFQSAYDQKDNVNWLLNNDYKLRPSIEYPSLLEYWSDKKQKSYFFIADYHPQVIHKTFGCSPDFREDLAITEKSVRRMGDTSCNMYGVIANTVIVRVRFDGRLLPEGLIFHQTIDQLISSFIVSQ